MRNQLKSEVYHSFVIPYDKIVKEYEEYFKELEEKTREAFKIAEEARKKGFDPVNEVEIKIARDMLDRVIEIVGLLVPELKKVPFNIRERIRKYEQEYGVLDWRVAMKIGEDVAKAIYEMKHDKRYAIEAGLRIAEAYATLGIVAAPIEGIAKVEIKKRLDGKEYLAVYAAGPIRAAGGTAAAIIVLFADYLRKVFGLETWDPTEEEIQRYVLEVFEYDRIKKLQYRPTRRELEFLFRHLPVEVSGEPTEDKEVSNYKDLPRIETNRIRGGMALVIGEGLCQKAKKIWKKLKKWGKDFGLEHWSWLEEFLKIQEEEKAKGVGEIKEEKKEEGEIKIKPNWKYLEEIAAGRAVLALPMAKGGFRLRYGKSRINGFETVSIHPATATLLYDFIAVGTQIRPERPGKSAGITFCETIEPPVVKLKDGSVVRVRTVKQAKKIRNQVEKILFLGDMLVNYGILLNNLDTFLPVGYCEEWWILEFEKKAMEKVDGFVVKFDMFKPRELFEIEGLEKLSKYLGISEKRLEKLIRYPLKKKPKIEEAIKISLLLDVPLHPRYTYHWKDVKAEDVLILIEWVKKAEKKVRKEIKVGDKKIKIYDKIIGDYDANVKRILEGILVLHKVENNKIVIEYPDSTALLLQLGLLTNENLDIPEGEYKNGLDIVQRIAEVKVRDKVGIYIGARVGRPEKAKMRKMKGRPHMLFPVGEEGGRMRNFNEALKIGKINADLPLFYCEKCKRYTLYPKCEFCGSETIQYYQCPKCKRITKLTKCPECDIPTKPYAKRSINPKEYLELALKNLKISASEVPQILKGVRGLSNAKKIPERLEKGILRAKYGLHVFRDGTIRFDSIELPIFYFKPKDLLYVSIEKLKELGYTHDIFGRPLESEDQILELKPQDVILPAGGENFAKLLVKVAQFVDEELQRLYGLKPYYNVRKPEDLIGHLGIAIAPHISAGTVVRIIGFSKTQAYFAHPLLHASCRRNCDGDELSFILLLDALLNFSKEYLPKKRGGRMDAPLVLTVKVVASEVDDEVHKYDAVWNYPLELYEAAQEMKPLDEVKLETIGDRLGKPEQYFNWGFMHDIRSINYGNKVSMYKRLKTMTDKLLWMIKVAELVRASDPAITARVVIDGHFARDVKGNLRKFSTQVFRCVKCNEKYRRVPLSGKCPKCGGRIVFTVSEGTVKKYLGISLWLADKVDIGNYAKQSLETLRMRVEQTFGKPNEKQADLTKWFKK